MPKKKASKDHAAKLAAAKKKVNRFSEKFLK